MKVLTDEGLTKLWSKTKQTAQDYVNTEKERATSAEEEVKNELDTHTSNFSNPHKVTKAQVGLDKVDNTADADKVVASADKLTTSRKIWGQEFDGTADVSGDIALDGNIVTPGDAQLVDLGLPSGTLWMDRNVGASSPEDAGLYFAWGETTGYTADGVGKTKQFSWVDYKFGNSPTKYNTTDGLTTLETTDDAVLQNVYKYSMPTKEQLQELIDGTTSTWTSQNGVNGMLFTSKTNGNSIFVPAAGYGDHGSMYYVGSYGLLWSSSLGEGSTSYAWYLYFGSGNVDLSSSSRSYGRSVRGVATPAEGSKTYTFPSSSGTLALTSDVETETARATAKEEELQSAIDSKTVKAGRFITVSDDNTVGLNENLIPATVQAGGCSFNATSDTANEINAVYFSLTDSSTPSVQITHQTSGTVDAGASLSPESLIMQDKNKNTAIISAGGISTTNGSIKFTTNPTDSTKNIIKATQDLARISEDGTESLFVGTTGIGITSKTTKDIVGAQYNTYHVGSDSDTTEYTAVAPLGSDNKIPAQYIDSSNTNSSTYPYLFFSWGSGGSDYFYEEITVKEGEIISLEPWPIETNESHIFIYTTETGYDNRVEFQMPAQDREKIYLINGPYTASICTYNDERVIIKAEQCSEVPSDAKYIFDPTNQSLQS